MDERFYIKLINWLNRDKAIYFYQSSQWRKMRRLCFERDNYECQRCKDDGKFSQAEVVHHIEHLKHNPLRALDMTNLISLCNVCHNKVHPEKLPNHQPKFTNLERW